MVVYCVEIFPDPKRCEEIHWCLQNDDLSGGSETVQISHTVQHREYSTWTVSSTWSRFLLQKRRNYRIIPHCVNWSLASRGFFGVHFVNFCFKARTSKISDAVNENLLDFFTLTAVKSPTDSNTDPNFIPLSADTSLSVTGQIKSCNKYYIFVRFTGESLGFMSNGHNLNRKFNIAFHVNRTPFQLEHNVLERMRELDLFDCLINNPLYAKACTECIDYDSYFFKYF